MKMTVFWDVALCSLVEIYRRYTGAFTHHHQGDSGRRDDGGSKHLRNIDQFIPHYMSQHSKSQPFKFLNL
jgi:hypothetical protein